MRCAEQSFLNPRNHAKVVWAIPKRKIIINVHYFSKFLLA
jgi:hypothetical protein